jgi:hypothetical protein
MRPIYQQNGERIVNGLQGTGTERRVQPLRCALSFSRTVAWQAERRKSTPVEGAPVQKIAEQLLATVRSTER